MNQESIINDSIEISKSEEDSDNNGCSYSLSESDGLICVLMQLKDDRTTTARRTILSSNNASLETLPPYSYSKIIPG